MISNFYWINGNILKIEYEPQKGIYFKKIALDLLKTINQKDLQQVPKIYWRSLLREISYNKKTLADFLNKKPYFPKCYFNIEDIKNLENNKRYFLKPEQGSQGKGIEIIENLNEIESIPENYLIQEEIIPDLHYQKKYDIRIYFLLIHYQNQYFSFISTDGKVRICSEDYLNNSKSGNITNSSQIKKNSNNFHQQMKWSSLETHQNDIKITKEIFHDVFMELKKHFGKKYHHQNTFNLYGVDIIKDNTGKFFILEFNSNPNYFHPNDSKEIIKMKEEILENSEKILENIIYQETNQINYWMEL